MNDKSILKLALNLLKYFIVNNKYEVLFINNNYFNDSLISDINYNHKHSMTVIDYNYNIIQKNKKKFNNEKEFELNHKNYYAPFNLFEHIELFSAINYHLTNNIEKSEIFESVLTFYYLCLNTNLFFLKSITNFKDFLNLLLKDKDITKISPSKNCTYYILKIISCLPYLLHNELSFGSSGNIILQIKSASYSSDDVQLVVDPKYKISAINCILNLWTYLNTIVASSLNKILPKKNKKINKCIVKYLIYWLYNQPKKKLIYL
jgi:hypothetical protein